MWAHPEQSRRKIHLAYQAEGKHLEEPFVVVVAVGFEAGTALQKGEGRRKCGFRKLDGLFR
jgi:hypothetical protein